MTPEQIKKLPKWAQDEFNKLQRERDMAVRDLNKWCDEQTPSKVRVDEMACTGEERGPSLKVRYVQTKRVTFTHAGVELEVSVLREGEIGLQWSDEHRNSKEVAFIPGSFQQARLVAKEHMR